MTAPQCNKKEPDVLRIIDDPTFSDGILWIFGVAGLLFIVFMLVALGMLILARPKGGARDA
jgi:hypothetical protein